MLNFPKEWRSKAPVGIIKNKEDSVEGKPLKIGKPRLGNSEDQKETRFNGSRKISKSFQGTDREVFRAILEVTPKDFIPSKRYSITYVENDGSKVDVILVVMSVFSRDKVFFVYAFDERKQALRLFRVDRIQSVRSLPSRKGSDEENKDQSAPSI